MRTKAIEFGGCCALRWCDSGNNTSDRGGVIVALDGEIEEDYDGEMVCCDCALRLARLLKKRVRQVTERQAQGLEYRNDKWRRPAAARALRDPKAFFAMIERSKV